MRHLRDCDFLWGFLLAVFTLAQTSARAEEGTLQLHDDGVRITVVSSAAPTWQAVVDRRKGGIITELNIPAAGNNVAATDGGRFEGLCNLVYVDFQETGNDAGYIAKGTYAYHGRVENATVSERTPQRVLVTVSGRSGNQVTPRTEVLAYRQQYEFLPDRMICSGEIDWLFHQIVPESRPELLQLNSKFARDAVAGEFRVWNRTSGPLPLPQTNSKGANFPSGVDYPVTVEVPLAGNNAIQFRSLELPEQFTHAKFYWNEFPRQIEGHRGFAFKAWEGWPGNGPIQFKNDRPIRYRYELAMSNKLPSASPVITGINWAPKETIIRQAPGSDNWPMTWGDDDVLYTAYGDGNGFKPFVEEKLSLGLAKISGGPDNFQAENLRSSDIEQKGHGAAGKKASGILMVDGVLYAIIRNADNSLLAKSTDHGKTWTWTDWKWANSFGCPTFLNFGKNYSGARDEYVYVYSTDGPSAYVATDQMVLARVPKQRIMEREAYEFFVERNSAGEAVWSTDIEKRGAVFTNRGKCYRSGITFNSALKRYLWCQIHPESRDSRGPRFQGGFAIYDAPEPWGPWTTVYYTDDWDVGPGDTSSFPTKWMSNDGRTMYLVFSGDDSFSVRKADLITTDFNKSKAPPN